MIDTKALREKVLDLAIRGKLVPQDPNDEPASVLLERIRAEKEQMVKDGKLKAKDIKNDTIIFKGDDNLHYEQFPDGTVKCIEEEIPFELPEGWLWCRLSNLICLYSGQDLTPTQYNDKANGIPYVTGASNIKNGKVIINRWTEFPTTHATKGDLLLSCKGTVGEMAWCEYDDVHIARQFMALRSLKGLYNKYLKIVVSAELVNITSKVNGLIPGISRETILNTVFPFPPYEEQKRIYDKCKEILTIITNTEIDKNDLAYLISKTKSKILDLAIRGKLVPQNPDDEPASVLLERIRAEKEELIKAGKIKRDKKESVIFKGEDNSYYEKVDGSIIDITEEIPFDIPNNSIFIRFKHIWELLSGRDLSPNDYNDKKQGLPYITGASNFNNGKIEISRWTQFPQVITKTGDLLITCKGTVGEMAFNDFGDAHIARQIMAIRNIYDLNIEYLSLCVNFYINSLKNLAKGLIPGISREDILNLFIPLYSEQYQATIVNKVNELLSTLDNIEKNLS